jgi:hypothetical protein
MEVLYYSETLVSTYKSTLPYKREDQHRHLICVAVDGLASFSRTKSLVMVREGKHQIFDVGRSDVSQLLSYFAEIVVCSVAAKIRFLPSSRSSVIAEANLETGALQQ